jgi:hypothetical protein
VINFTDYPLLLLLVVSALLWLAARLGARLKNRYPLDEEMRQDFSVMLGAALSVLALIIGFSFSMATERYDQRKNLEEAEANAIGTEYTRADLLGAADGAKLRALLKSYLGQRIQFYTAEGEQAVSDANARMAKLQAELWAAVIGPVAATPTPVTALVVSGMNDVLNAQGYTQAAWWNRIPVSAWGLMIAIAILCNLLVGYGVRSVAFAKRLLFIFPLFVAIALGFIADIDSPRRGVIRVQPQNMISLLASLPGS